MDFTSASERLGKTGLLVWPAFLAPTELNEIRGDLERLQKERGFSRAGTGQGKGNAVRDLVRRDEVHWLERSEAAPVAAQTLLWRKLDLLQQALNRTLFLGLSRFDGHYAAYPEGGFYKRHLDCFQLDDARLVSVVLYLNNAWIDADGGRLRVYGENSYTDVDPLGGTLVCFMSRESEHEVLPSHAPRLSFTGWFKRDSPLAPFHQLK